MTDSTDSVLAIDFGTTATAAAVAWQGQVRPLSFGQHNWLSSAVFRRADDGTLVVGTEADRRAAIDPLAYEPTPKRLIGQGAVELGGARVSDVDLVAAVLSTVAAEADRQCLGIVAGPVVLTHPARWAADRRAVLAAAATRAGLSSPHLVPEPVAAAAHHGALGVADRFRAGEHSSRPAVYCVYDLGGGTFDVAVVTDEDGTVELAGPPGGVDPLGGVDFDRLLFDHVGRRLAERDPDGWSRLADPTDHRQRADRRALLAEVRAAKEHLSVTQSAAVFAPGIDPAAAEIMLTRVELEALLAPSLDRTVEAVEDTLRAARLEPAELTALVLTGGSSRIPAVADLLWRRLGVAPMTQDDPKLVVALGAVTAHRAGLFGVPSPRAQTPARPVPRPRDFSAGAPAPIRRDAVTQSTDAELSPAAARLLTAQPALAAALASHPDGVGQIDDEALLVALLTAPGLVEQVTADPGTIGRLRTRQFVQYREGGPGDGPLPPTPVRVLFADRPDWLAVHAEPTAGGQIHDAGASWWALRAVRTLNSATAAERTGLLADPRWRSWVATDLPDWLYSDDASTIVSLDTPLPPAPVEPWARVVHRPPDGPSPEQRRILQLLAPVYAPVPEGGIAAAGRTLPVDAIVEALGRPSAKRWVQLVLPDTWCPTDCLLYPAGPDRPPAMIIPIVIGTGWSGFPTVITPDVVQSIQAKLPFRLSNRVEDMGRRVVVRTTVRPGATCPPSAAQFDLRTKQADELAGQLRRLFSRG
ncbi:Hsp70 family protein [Nakamurella leprariae]|uniref:Hsp70 family protein n=1 Tax=Nakamurella leprariae TaxID=2803911 RepID=A0A938YF08_9ACTN|nr:Hsp70 family protein [Nakamurella leprariae]MBM9468649.1 Hsp70 family protein [Nakamurella leprariae]